MRCPFSFRSNNPAIITEKETLSYADCDRIIDSIALPKGIVRFVPKQDPLSILTFFACMRRGQIAYPISHRLPDRGKTVVLTLGPYRKTSPYLDDTQIATHIATSGTTGKPKIIAHTIGNHFYSALGSNQILPLTSDDRWQLSLPLFHVGGIAILFRCFLAGAAVTFGTATHLSLVPTQLKRMLSASPKGIKRILLGGDVIPETLFIEAKKLGFPIYLTYGMTEMSSQVCTNIEGTYSAGHPLPYRKLKIVDGEIYVGGKTLVPAKGQWHATGDLGWYDTSGLHLRGRKDRMFISGGENIHPEEIEKALLSLPGIVAATVHSKNHEEYGKVPVASIESSVKYSDEELKERLLALLPRYQIPVQCDLR